MDRDSQRTKLVWEAALGFVGFFTFLALIQAVWNLLSDNPKVGPSILLAALLLVTWLVWRRYRSL